MEMATRQVVAQVPENRLSEASVRSLIDVVHLRLSQSGAEK